ncbi:CRE-NHR-237 protein [Caenorhabditis remanei]|uniref:CRE-NHR-237 protein n=1 Tax=Caenorhabditis remanei TaxID=31234 RepID=E3LJK3_CAERE|nr:CRE-NHR-237 protein [Caenorhabditis remanei]
MESPPSLQICGVCGETADAVHFGAHSCRACAAFFRRKVAAGKPIQVSRCAGNCRLENQLLRRLCASCRYDKCIKIGMKTSAVLSRIIVKSEPSSSEFSPWMGENLLDQMKVAYERLENARSEVFNLETRVPKTANYKELNEMCNIDISLIKQHYSLFFQSITPTDDDQRGFLGNHFIVPYALLDGAFRSQDGDLDFFLMPNGDYVDIRNLDNFYQNPEEKDGSIAESVTVLMKPYWMLNQRVLRKNVKEVKLDLSEYLFVSALIFWDFGIPNQSDECIKVCKTMRSRIFEELTDYEKSIIKTDDHSLRVGEIVIVLQAVQKALGIMHECNDISMVYNLYGRECPLFKSTELNEFK